MGEYVDLSDSENKSGLTNPIIIKVNKVNRDSKTAKNIKSIMNQQ